MSFSRRKLRAFTLLELVLVMVIIAIALTLAAPKLRGWSRGRQLRDSADQFISLTRIARSQAAATGQIYRITIDSQNGTFQLSKQDGQNFVSETTDLGDLNRMPEGAQLQLIGQTQSNTIDFYPSGRTQETHVKFTSRQGETILVECLSAAEEFAINTGVPR